MTRRILTTVQRGCLALIPLVVVGVNTINWTAYVNDWYDREMQWTVAQHMITGSGFLMALYIWIGEHLSKRKYGIIISGWVALYLLIDLIGVILGYNLHTKGLMVILLLTAISGIAHLIIRLWQK